MTPRGPCRSPKGRSKSRVGAGWARCPVLQSVNQTQRPSLHLKMAVDQGKLDLPKEPGVYLFKRADDRVLYVGEGYGPENQGQVLLREEPRSGDDPPSPAGVRQDRLHRDPEADGGPSPREGADQVEPAQVQLVAEGREVLPIHRSNRPRKAQDNVHQEPSQGFEVLGPVPRRGFGPLGGQATEEALRDQGQDRQAPIRIHRVRG